MLANYGLFSVLSMAKCLNVSRSRFYEFMRKQKNPNKGMDSELLKKVRTTWESSRKSFGVRRIHQVFKRELLPFGVRKIRKAMKIEGIQGKQVKKFRVVTTESNHKEPAAPDLVRRNFSPKSKNLVWVSDVTFVRSQIGWFYLCTILDLYSRKVVGWSLGEKNDNQLVLSSLEKAVASRNPGDGLIFHSDRGSNFCAKSVRNFLTENGILRSNARKGNCWDNAVAESFFSSMKREMEYNFFSSKQDAEDHLFDYIEVFYNRQRLHSFLDYMSPVEFEKKVA